jgi:hypothetical protein
MSNFLALAMATETVRQLLDAAVKADVDSGAEATAVRPGGDTPGGPGKTPKLGVNIFLYQVTPNAAYRNCDLPTRTGDGAILQRPRAALDLHYLLSCYGDDRQLEPQRCLGSAVRTLHQEAVLTRAQIVAAKPAFAFLANSDLDTDVELVKFTPTQLSFEDLSKLWSILLQTPYALSTTYMASLVLLEGKETPTLAPPATRRNLVVLPFMQPIVDRVLWAANPADPPGNDPPLVVGDTLTLVGRHLRGEITWVRVGDAVTLADSATDTRVTAKLAEPPFPAGSLRAGAQAITVTHGISFGTAADPHRGPTSPVVAQVVSPKITAVSAPSHTTVDTVVTPTVGKTQRVQLILNSLAPGPPASHVFSQPLTADTNSIAFTISGVPTGDYLVRISVDGAESPLDVDGSGNLAGTPKVHVP